MNLYHDIEARTNGEIYLGVVGPVRTGKSTFIKRFMELMVLPNMDNEPDRTRAMDELPQSAAGKTVMTTEPKFIPKNGANIRLDTDTDIKVRLVDCVGFMVNGAQGHMENEEERLVKTPWLDYEIPFTKAAEIGTRKVITDHATLGIVVTCDGSFGEIPREAYIDAEERTVMELKKIGKPFLMLLNSSTPYSEATAKLVSHLEEQYHVSVLPVNCMQLTRDDVTHILETLLYEFPVSKVEFYMDKWVEMLPANHMVKEALIKALYDMLQKTIIVKDVKADFDFTQYIPIKKLKLDKINMANGVVSYQVDVDDTYYYQMLSDMTGTQITGEYQLISMIRELSKMRNEYEKTSGALLCVKQKGYGVVTPELTDITLEEPVVIKHGNKYGVRIKAVSPSIHMIKANIETEIAPIVGSEEQARDLIEYIKDNANNEEGIWNTNIFGKTIEQLVEDGIRGKISLMTDECQMKLQETMQKIVNDSNGGMVCIII